MTSPEAARRRAAWKANAGCALMIAAAVGAVLVVLVWLIPAVSGWACANRFDGPETRWSYFAGCQVKTAHGWIPEQNYRGLD